MTRVNDRGMVCTDDGAMVRVRMTDPAQASKQECSWLSVEQALRLESEGKCVIDRNCEMRNSECEIHSAIGNSQSAIEVDRYEKTPEGLVFVEHTDPSLIPGRGLIGTYGLEYAKLGEREGKWRILTRKCGMRNAECEMRIVKCGIRNSFRNPNSEFCISDRSAIANPQFAFEVTNVRRKWIAWLADRHITGGAELSETLVIKIGRDCGYLIDVVPTSRSRDVILKSLEMADLVVIGNIWGLDPHRVSPILRLLYEDRKPYVKYEHDHRELSRPEFSRYLFRNSRLNIFLSPIHLKNHQDVLGCDGIALPLAIDVDAFSPVEGEERVPNTALVSNVRSFKSWAALQTYVNDHPEITVNVLVDADCPVTGQNVKPLRMVPHEEMPRLYSAHEYLVHLLDGWGAGERVVIEACLCGCKVIANEKVGHLSWGWDLTDTEGLKEKLRKAPYEFWKRIGELHT